MKYNIIGDIAGEYETLIALVRQMPDNYTISVGDMVDRGEDSNKVIEYFRHRESTNTGDAIMGNHECLMLDYYERTGIYNGLDHPWLFNGGGRTIKSYGGEVPEDVLEWVKSRPLYKKLSDRYLVSHSFVHGNKTLEEAATRQIDSDYAPANILWNRFDPMRKDYFQITGHNSHWGLRWFGDYMGEFGVCIDTSRENILTGVVIDTDLEPLKENIQVYQQPFIRRQEGI